jgi:hypothetical protein
MPDKKRASPGHIEGEVFGHTPVYARVAERRLRLIVPAPSDYHWRGTE